MPRRWCGGSWMGARICLPANLAYRKRFVKDHPRWMRASRGLSEVLEGVNERQRSRWRSSRSGDRESPTANRITRVTTTMESALPSPEVGYGVHEDLSRQPSTARAEPGDRARRAPRMNSFCFAPCPPHDRTEHSIAAFFRISMPHSRLSHWSPPSPRIVRNVLHADSSSASTEPSSTSAPRVMSSGVEYSSGE